MFQQKVYKIKVNFSLWIDLNILLRIINSQASYKIFDADSDKRIRVEILTGIWKGFRYWEESESDSKSKFLE